MTYPAFLYKLEHVICNWIYKYIIYLALKEIYTFGISMIFVRQAVLPVPGGPDTYNVPDFLSSK